MKTIEVKKVPKSLSDYVNNLGNDILILTSDKQPIAALVSLKGVDLESFSLSTNSDFLEIIEQARKEIKSGQKLSLEEMKREVFQDD
jgi:hypothetical protein